jgi:hypothetical protein
MAKTPRDANGGTPIDPSDVDVRNATRQRSRTRSLNSVERNRSITRDEEASGGRPWRERIGSTNRPREDAARGGDFEARRGRPKDDPARGAVNAIRLTPRRVRDVTAAPGPSGARGFERDRHAVPEGIKERFVQVGNKYHFPDGTRAFTDHGNRLTSPSENTEVIKSLISIAQARGWSDITISGTQRFRREAWFAARLAGLDVRGYSPTEFEQGRLVRALAREQPSAQHPAAERGSSRRVSSEPERAPRTHDEQTDGRTPGRERSMQVGRLVEHGAAPYRHDPHNAMSYFIRIETQNGEREIWGVDLQRALKESLTQPQRGDEIGVRALRRDAVKVFRPEHDAEGRMIGEKAHEAHRNAWIVEKRDFFRERAQAARVLRDASVDRQAAVKQHPELLGTYLQLHAAELAAKTLRSPDDQRRFVASVRTALADAVARGEPLSPVPLKETATQRREPRVPAARERDAAPAR